MPAGQHPIFKAPSSASIKLWRYMDFAKFVSMLEHTGLFFTRADCLGDPFEGSIPRANERLQADMAKEWSPDELEMLESLSDWRRRERENMFISCWHMNECESPAMWGLYARTEEAICIQSTYERLRDHVDEEVYLGEVQYIDYENELIYVTNGFYPFVHKRKFFAYEREIRAVIWKPSPFGEQSIRGGLWKAVNLNQLIEHVFVAPTSKSWFRELVEDMAARYSLSIPVKQSSLDDQPSY